jgi:hypothetical protein
MRLGSSSVLVVALIASLALAAPIQQDEKVLLLFKPELGQVSKSKGKSRIEFSGGGQKFVIEDTSTFEAEVAEVTDDYCVLKSKTTSYESKMNGEEMPTEEDDSISSMKIMRNGSIIGMSQEPPYEDEDQEQLENRLSVALSVVFSDKPVGVGDTWAHDFPANASLKTVKARATYKVEAREDIGGAAVLKIKMDYAELEGKTPVKSSSTQWIEIASGDAIKTESETSNVEFDFGFPQPVKLLIKSSSQRTSGGLVKSDSNPTEEEGQDEGNGIDEAVEGAEKLDGLFPIYRKEDEGQVTLKMEIREDQLGKPMMLQATAASGLADGRLTAGDPISDLVFEFRKMPNGRMVMYVPNYLFRVDPNSAVAKSVRRSFPDSIVDSFDIEAEQKDRKSYLIDVTSVFRGDLSRLNEMLASGGGGGMAALMGGGGMYIQDRENSYIASVKNFPQNLAVETSLNFLGRGGGGGMASMMGGGGSTVDDRSVLVRLSLNLFALPTENGYRPRHFDSRVGYFTSDYQSFDNDKEVDSKKMLINRWHMVKKDPSAAVSDPVEPIVFWIDNSVPVEYRESVRQAIEGWNEAFLAAGFSNAVVAKQMPDDADFDHADMRFNVVRWVSSASDAYAIALFRTNPLTGQILNGSVSVDGNIVKIFAQEHDQIVLPSTWQARLAARIKAATATCDHPGRCQAMAEGALNFSAGRIASSLMGELSQEEYVNQFVRWVVGHEMGHMMGLRHNFVASTLLNLDELGSPVEVAKEGTASSLMDYVAFNPSALGATGSDYYSQTVGRYDRWAIEYGYKPVPIESEEADLKAIATRGSERGLAWLGDEFADSIDPYVTRFDLGADPLAYWTKMGDVMMGLVKKLPSRSLKSGDDYYGFTRDLQTLMGQYGRSVSELTRFVGGVRRSPAHVGDAGGSKPLVNIDAKTQKAALDQVVKMVFMPDSLALPKDYFKNLAPNPKAGLLEQLMGGGNDYPMRDAIGGFATSALSSLLEPGVLNRLANAEYEAEDGEAVLKISDLFAALRGSIWAELKSGTLASPLRRDIQRAHLRALAEMVLERGSAPADAVALARWQLTELHGELKKASGRKDADSKVYYSDLATIVGKVLNAEPTIGSTGGGSGPSLLDLLMGGVKKSGGRP